MSFRFFWLSSLRNFYFKKAPNLFRVFKAPLTCSVCGCAEILYRRNVISTELEVEWNLSSTQKAQLNQREGEICVFCGSSLRIRNLAESILKCGYFQQKPINIHQAITTGAFNKTLVCEINACGSLHNFLFEIPNIFYSEYGSRDPLILSEDLMALSYPSESFDMVIHSDTLEHVPDIRRALAEIKRVLRPGGFSIFTVPIIPDGRPTKQRAIQKVNGQIEHIQPASYHGGRSRCDWRYLVFHEFGRDFFNFLDDTGMKISVFAHKENPMVLSIMAKKLV